MRFAVDGMGVAVVGGGSHGELIKMEISWDICKQMGRATHVVSEWQGWWLGETVASGQELPRSGVMTLSTEYQSAFDNRIIQNTKSTFETQHRHGHRRSGSSPGPYLTTQIPNPQRPRLNSGNFLPTKSRHCLYLQTQYHKRSLSITIPVGSSQINPEITSKYFKSSRLQVGGLASAEVVLS
ncbi:hypothetical protein AG1IA_08876 [Rhizoctonia solani AG-1 IA]|uniref:Uncharacterized protein n=1 Tax=Thanatephorus cucumeris (strain AG1-IA) TaxID=983506 RepID=L8WGJ7_THACA|nr:hypothetical protein AG1IA_08876 [Rhizoctonia solani AG-1 IA]